MTEDDARKALNARAKELADEDAANADSRDTVELQQDSVGRLSRMDALQQQAMAQAQGRRRAAEKLRINAALARLEPGEILLADRLAETPDLFELWADWRDTLTVQPAARFDS